jgi:four helix bundle protein
MSTGIKRFEDLIAWQKARALAGAIYRATTRGKFERDFGLKDQITRAAGSVMSNIAEGFERGTKSEFHQYLVIAKSSCGEVRSQLYLASDVGYLPKPDFDRLMAQANEVARYVNALRAAVQKRRDQEKSK